MFDILKTRFKQGYKTAPYPKKEPELPPRYRGLPAFDGRLCAEDCRKCASACPTSAITCEEGSFLFDAGRCLFCAECEKACESGALKLTKEYRQAANSRKDLIAYGGELKLARAMNKKMLSLFGRSLKLRQVSAGGCNACEADVNVLSTLAFDMGRFGVQFVASPRHADGILVTGPVTKNMELALKKTYEAVPSPKIVIASGACAISGGPFAGHSQVLNGVDKILPVDLYVPGCPPNPYTVLDGLLRLIGKIKGNLCTQSSP